MKPDSLVPLPIMDTQPGLTFTQHYRFSSPGSIPLTPFTVQVILTTVLLRISREVQQHLHFSFCEKSLNLSHYFCSYQLVTAQLP